ncbi:hypothetical protein [uncultured Thomasclavelia sp.]|uniref:phage tail protein n=1 Tax=uncultured Thomasclavelia sp. TaxID=3025759 RepID=UPI0026217515|nr:hypothetical protein [uncultured Thomasclavelia sp.]
MSGTTKVKGLTIQIYGDDKEFQDTVTGTKKALNELQKESMTLNSHLKFDPKNVDKLNQRLKSLQQQVKLNESLIEKYNAELNKMDKADIGSDQWLTLQKNIATAEKNIAQCNRYIKDTEDALKKVDNQNLSKVRKAINGLADNAEKIGNTLTDKLTKPIAAIATATAATTQATKEYREDVAKLETNALTAGANLEITNQALKDLNAITGESDSNVEGLSNLLQAGFKDNNLTRVVEELSGAVIKFPDTLKIESLADGLQETLATGEATGQFGELLDRLGIGADNFTEKLKKCKTEAEKQQLVLDTLANAGLADVNKAYRENNKSLIENSDAQYDLNEAISDLGKTMEPVVAKVTQFVADLLKWFNDLDPKIKVIIAAVAGIAAAIGPVITIVTKLKGAVSALNGVFGKLNSKFAIIAGVIAGVIALFVYLYNTNEDFKNLIDTIAAEVLPALQTAFETVSTFINETVIPVLQALWDWIDKYIMPIIGEVASFLVDVLYEAFKSVAIFVRDTLTPIIDALKTAFEWVYDKLSAAKTAFDEAYESFKKTEAFKILKDVLQSVVDVAEKLIDSLKWLSENASLIFGNTAAAAKKAVENAKGASGTLGVGGLFDSGGFGNLINGGDTTLYLSTNFNVTNNGTPISVQTLRKWGNVITDIVDENLGRRGR